MKKLLLSLLLFAPLIVAAQNMTGPSGNGNQFNALQAIRYFRPPIQDTLIALKQLASNAINGDSLGAIVTHPGDSILYRYTGAKWEKLGANADLSTVVKYVDTAAMLGPYLRKGDTIYLSNRIDTKVGFTQLTDSLNSRGFYTTSYVKKDSIVLQRTSIDTTLININLGYVNPDWYGAIGDGVTDDHDALQAAINAATLKGKYILLNSRRYYTSATLTIPGGASIKGTGTGNLTCVYVDGDYAAFDITGNNVYISGVSILGSGRGSATNYVTIRPNQHGIRIFGSTDLSTSKSRIQISDCAFYSLGGAGIYISKNVGNIFDGGAQISNCYTYGGMWGFYCDERGEYNSFSNCQAEGNQIGFRNRGGNNNWVGGFMVSNRTGVYLEGGENDGHGVISGSRINHNQDYAIWANTLSLTYLFNACMMYSNDVYINSSPGIKFEACEFGVVSTIYVQTSSDLRFNDCKFINTPVFNLNWNGTDNTGSASIVNFFNTEWKAGMPTTVINNKLYEGINIQGYTKTDSVSTGYFQIDKAGLKQINVYQAGNLELVHRNTGDFHYYNNNASQTPFSILNNGSVGFSNTSPTSTVHINGSFAASITTVTTSTTLDGTHHTILVDNSGSDNITLPDATNITGRIYIIKKISAALNNVVVNTTSSQTIDGVTSKTLTSQDSAIGLQASGGNWVIIFMATAATTL